MVPAAVADTTNVQLALSDVVRLETICPLAVPPKVISLAVKVPPEIADPKVILKVAVPVVGSGWPACCVMVATNVLVLPLIVFALAVELPDV